MRSLAPIRFIRRNVLLAAILMAVFAVTPLAPAFSTQSGSRILYAAQDPRTVQESVVSIQGDGTGRRLLAGGTYGAEAQWSPDGRKVAYINSSNHVVVMNADGSSKVQFSYGPIGEYDSFPVWSPDGTRIAFQRGHDDCGVKVIAKSLDGSSKVLVTNDSSGEEGAEPPRWPVSWSPDGSRIAYVRFDFCTGEPGGQFESDVYTGSSVSGSDEVKVTDNANQPLWSPVENKLVYATGSVVRHLNNLGKLVVSAPDGSQRTVLADRYANWYAWSPEGWRIAYSTGDQHVFGSCGSIYQVRLDGTHSRRLTAAGLCTDKLAWSPDGGALAFIAKASGASSRDWDVYRIGADGAVLLRLTFESRTVEEVDW